MLALEHHPDQKPFIGQWTREQHLETMARPGREHWIIEGAEDATPQGYLIAYDARDAGYGIYIKRIALAEKGAGIGRAALQQFMRHVREAHDTGVVSLAVRSHNERAQRCYRAVGFGVVDLDQAERARFLAQVDPVPDECLIMVFGSPWGHGDMERTIS